MTSLRSGLAHLHFHGTVDVHLAALRADIDDFSRRLGSEYGEGNEVVQRAEQLSAAIQRLEWALARQRPRSRSASAGGRA